MTKESQNKTVLQHLQQVGEITCYLAVRKYGIYRLSGRIHDLRRAGYKITSHLVNEGSRHWSVYRIAWVSLSLFAI